MWKSIRELGLAAFKLWWFFLIDIVFGIIGAYQSMKPDFSISGAVFLALAGLGLFFAMFMAFHRARVERDEVKKRLEDAAGSRRNRLHALKVEGDSVEGRIGVVYNRGTQELQRWDADWMDWQRRVEECLSDSEWRERLPAFKDIRMPPGEVHPQALWVAYRRSMLGQQIAFLTALLRPTSPQ